jgi:predicted ATPase/DNA-binding SARP family transcriptional activator
LRTCATVAQHSQPTFRDRLLEQVMTTDLQIRLLGGLSVSQGDVTVTGFVSTKVPALLAYLAVTRRAHQRDALATLLWSEMGDAAAANNLRQALSNLRKLVDPYLTIGRETVQFCRDCPVDLDVATFEQAIAAARAAPLAARTAALQRACDLYQGDFLAGVLVRDAPDFDEWLLAQRLRLREQAIHALHVLGDLYLAQAQYGRAIDCATRLLALDAWREAAHRQLMTALAHSGRRVAALAQYESCRQVLLAELGIEPAEETTALAARIRAAGSTPRHNLPPAAGLVGRAEEMATIHQRVLQPECRLLTITGAGGMGKTRLALHAAAQAHQRGLFLDGVFFVELTAVTTAGGLLSAVAAALGLHVSDSKPLLPQVLAYVRAKELLLVLDNFDHLLDEAPTLVQMSEQAPQVKMLITSREALNVQPEWHLPIHGLPYPEPGAGHLGAAHSGAGIPVAAAETYAGVQLFVARAHAVRPDFALDTVTLPHVAAICRHVDGMPLGIELAAAQLRHYECSEIAASIARNIDFLAASYRDVQPRHGSLRAVFDYSWELLPPSLRTTFAALAVFAGSFGQAEAQEVAGAGRAALHTLQDKSLLRRTGSDRYELHELLRQYSLGQLMPSAAEAARAAHSRAYCKLLAANRAALRSSAQKAAAGRIAQDYPNVRAAWCTAVAAGDVPHLLAGLDGLYHFLMVRSRFQEGADLFGWTHQVLASADLNQAETAELRRLVAYLAARWARFLIMLSRHAEAEDLLGPCLADLRARDDPAGIATALVYLGAACTSLGAYAQAQAHLEESLDLRRGLSDDWGQAVCHLELAGLAFYRGDYLVAGEHCAEGLRLAGQAGDPQIIAHLLTGSSIVARQLGNYAAAQEFVARSLAVYEELEDPYGVVQGWLTLGGLACSLAQYGDAAAYYVRALDASLALGFRSGEAECHCRLGQVMAAQQQLGAAVAQLQIALRLTTEIHEAPLLLDTLYTVASLDTALLQAAPLAAWLLAQPELDMPRRSAMSALLASAGAKAAAMTVLDDSSAAVALAEQLLLHHAQCSESRPLPGA